MFMNGDWNIGYNITISAEECASKKNLADIVCPKVGIHSTCSLYTSFGAPVMSCADAAMPAINSKPTDETDGDDARTDNKRRNRLGDLFIVPPGRLFMLPAKKVGDVYYIHHIGEKIAASAVGHGYQ